MTIEASALNPPAASEGRARIRVTREDRAAAWPYRPACYREQDKAGWLDGIYDLCAPVMEAFARHRLTPPASGAGVWERHLEHVIDRDRYTAAIVLNNLKTLFAGYDWLRGPSRGSFAYDDVHYQLEFGLALDAFEASIAPLSKLAADKTDCTTDPEKVQAARAAGVEKFGALASPPPVDAGAGLELRAREVLRQCVHAHNEADEDNDVSIWPDEEVPVIAAMLAFAAALNAAPAPEAGES